MKKSAAFSLLALAGLTIFGCDLMDPMRPTPQADVEIFGNLLEAEPDPSRPGVWIANIRVGVPRAFGRSDGARPTPEVAGGILAVVEVTAETVVIVDDAPVALADIGPGTEVVALPVRGTTTMFSEKELHVEAAQLMDFETYARWRLPKLDLPGGPRPVVEDVAVINSSGVETAPIPVGGGEVLYFTARLRSPEVPGGDWIGARRNGLTPQQDGRGSFERSYRTELDEDGWSTPELVDIPGTESAQHVKLTWVDDDERRCYVTVSEAGGSPWVGSAERPSAADPWGEIVRMEITGEGDAFDAVALVGAPEKTVFATTRNGSSDLFMHDPAIGPAQQLQPEINTGGLEWGARIGPANQLFFVRGDRQLRFGNGSVSELRLPGPHRSMMIEAVPTADDEWLFFAAPKLRPVEFDFDIQVAPIAADGSIGPAVPVDEWRPY